MPVLVPPLLLGQFRLLLGNGRGAVQPSNDGLQVITVAGGLAYPSARQAVPNAIIVQCPKCAFQQVLRDLRRMLFHRDRLIQAPEPEVAR